MEDEPSINGMPSAAAVKRPYSVHIPKPLEILIPPIPKPQKTSLNGSHHFVRQSTLSAPPSSTTSFTTTTTASFDFDLLPFNSHSVSYTSLKDILPSPPSALLSPTPVTATTISSASTSSSAAPWVSCCEISIRNRLVKQAAWAYLQPTMSSSPSSSGRHLWSYFSGDFFWPVLRSVQQFLVDSAARVCNWLGDALWLLLCR